MRQFNRERVFENSRTGTRSTRIAEVLDRDVVVDRDYTIPSWDKGQWRTLFVDVRIVPPLATLGDEARRLLTLKPGTQRWGTGDYLKSLARALVKTVQDNWSPTKFHLIFHSAGYDSRLMSWAIRQGTTEDNRKRVLFACLGPESDGARRILQYEGWSDDQFVSITDLTAYYGRLLDFNQAWRAINGAALGIFNINYGLSWVLEDMGLIPKDENDIQQWTGFGTDYLLAGANNKAGNFLQAQFVRVYSTPISLSFFKAREIVYLYLGFDVLRTAVISSVRLGYRYRLPLLRMVNMELARVPTIDSRLPEIPSDLMQRCIDDYEGSWYGKNVRPGISGTASAKPGSYANWWSAWTAAAFCEHLLRDGYKLTVR